MLEQIVSIILEAVWYVAIGAPVVLAFVRIWLQSPSKGTWTNGEGDRSDFALSKAESLFFTVVVLAVLVAQVIYYAGGKPEAFKFVESPVFEFGWMFIGQFFAALTLFRTDWGQLATVAMLAMAAIFVAVYICCAFNAVIPEWLHAAFKALGVIVSVVLSLFKRNWFISEK